MPVSLMPRPENCKDYEYHNELAAPCIKIKLVEKFEDALSMAKKTYIGLKKSNAPIFTGVLTTWYSSSLWLKRLRTIH